MTSPFNTPVRQAKPLVGSLTKSPSLSHDYKKLFNEQHSRLSTKHQQDLELIDDIRTYVKARLSIEKDYTSALNKLAKQHSNHIAKKFTLLNHCDPPTAIYNNDKDKDKNNNNNDVNDNQNNVNYKLDNDINSESRIQRLTNNGNEEPNRSSSLYKVWSEHINRLQATSKNRADQFEQLIIIVDKLKDIRTHKASIGKKCLDTHLKKIHDDILISVADIEKARKLYYEDESQAKKARENEEKIKKKRSGLLTKFTDLQAKKEKTSAQREANDIQSTQARNDYIMALAAGNAHLNHYYTRDLNDFIHMIDDGVLDHCKIFMATLSECDINSLKDALSHAQYWSKIISLTGSQKTNSIFLDCEQSSCLRINPILSFEPCNNDPIQTISLEHNADYALQHEIDKWFTWFKKECRNLSHLMHQLDLCQHALVEGKKSIELNGQVTEDIEAKIIDLKQQVRKSEAAKLKAQARLKVIKEGGMQIEEWSTVESEIRADMARAQEELEARRMKEITEEDSNEIDRSDADQRNNHMVSESFLYESQVEQVHLQVSKDSDDSNAGASIHNLASVSRSNSNLVQNQQNAVTGYSALTDPSLVWQDEYSGAWGSVRSKQDVVVTNSSFKESISKSSTRTKFDESVTNQSYGLLGAAKQANTNAQLNQGASMTVQSSSPLSAIVDGAQNSSSPYPGLIGEAYKSDYECDYNRTGQPTISNASSVEPCNHNQGDYIRKHSNQAEGLGFKSGFDEEFDERMEDPKIYELVGKQVVAIYAFEKTNEDDLTLNEGDILKVTEVSDANWVKARNENTGQEGYIPTSYIQVRTENDHNLVSLASNEAAPELVSMPNEAIQKPDSIESLKDAFQNDEKVTQASEVCYCVALYDHKPDSNTFEDDGLPHLSLVQGEVMRIIDQGEDDGWWLVEKESSGIRGHVPSMLVEEVEEGDPNEQDDGDDDEYSDNITETELESYSKAMPTIDAPELHLSINVDEDNSLNQNDNDYQNQEKVEYIHETDKSALPSNATLTHTSFVIIQPTPEVESRRLEDSLASGDFTTYKLEQVENSSNEQPLSLNRDEAPKEVSYSVINESFVLEKLERQPNENEVQAITKVSEANKLINQEESGAVSTQEVEIKHGILDDCGPPAVLIENCYDGEPDSFSIHEDGDDDANDELENYRRGLMDESMNVHDELLDESIREKADEFSQQIIQQALEQTRDVNNSLLEANEDSTG